MCHAWLQKKLGFAVDQSMRVCHNYSKMQGKKQPGARKDSMLQITSRSNSYVKLVVSLKGKKGRDEQSLFVVEGEKSIRSALSAGGSVRFLAASSSYIEKNEAVWPETPLVMSDQVFKSISLHKAPQGILGVFETRSCPIGGVFGESRILYLDGVQQPENVGALARSAVCFGFGAVVASWDSADFYSPKAVGASAASLFSIKLAREGYQEPVLGKLMDEKYTLVGSDMDGQTGFAHLAAMDKLVLVVGNEGQGMRLETRSLCAEIVAVKIIGDCESLNVAVAGGILMHKLAGL